MGLLLQSHQEDRDELIARIQQRDQYVLQYIASTIAVLAASIATKINIIFIISLICIVPVMGVYFYGQVQRSYMIHEELLFHIRMLEEKIKECLIQQGVHDQQELFFQAYIDTKLCKKTRGLDWIVICSVLSFLLGVCLLHI